MDSRYKKSSTFLFAFSLSSCLVVAQADGLGGAPTAAHVYATPNDEFSLPLAIRLVMKDDLKGVEELAQLGILTESKDWRWGRTAMHWAQTKAMVELLKSKGLSVDDQDRDGKTPLMLAAEFGDYQKVNLFIASGAKVNLVDCAKRAALHYAAHKNDDRSVIALLLAGADRQAVDVFGQLPVAFTSNEYIKNFLENWEELFERAIETVADDLIEEVVKEETEKIIAEVLEELAQAIANEKFEDFLSVMFDSLLLKDEK
ncbi:ankyrin repeat domain-containing protein [Candidatus Babeliales bacterium]|nr:ankyrin repeat domain-containing protein [Candidatus Babeliales bacterium]